MDNHNLEGIIFDFFMFKSFIDVHRLIQNGIFTYTKGLLPTGLPRLVQIILNFLLLTCLLVGSLTRGWSCRTPRPCGRPQATPWPAQTRACQVRFSRHSVVLPSGIDPNEGYKLKNIVFSTFCDGHITPIFSWGAMTGLYSISDNCSVTLFER